ncbi:MAG: beta-glucosidase family protein [Chitinophagales bacterium]
MKPNTLFYWTVFLTAHLFLLFSCQIIEKKDTKETNLEEKVEALLSQMTLEEKVNVIHASSSFTSGGVERLKIPELIMSDGPHGVRHEHGRDWEKDINIADSSTYLPVGTALAATWNPDLGYKFGKVLGSEAKFRGKDIILGPGLNIIRDPLNGRNFEYLTEDPFLNSKMVTGYIKGVQEQGVAACAKHYIANSLEYQRQKVNVEMSDRAFREIYLPGFKAAVQEGNVYSIMSAYNKFRGEYCSHSGYLLDDILKEELGFEGVVISDWNAVKSTMEAAKVGLDIEMGTDLSMFATGLDYSKFFMADTLVALVKNGEVEEVLIDKKVRRILRLMHRLGKFGGIAKEGIYNSKEHQQTARTIADEAIVLLKNEGVLPLKKEGIKKLAVVGANVNHKHAGAGGSSQVKAFYEVTPLEGLQNLLGQGVEIEHSQGYEILRDNDKANPQLVKEAIENVKNADATIYIGGGFHGFSDDWNDNSYDAEDHDKPNLTMPFGQDELIQAVLKANPNTIVVLFGGGPMDMRAWQKNAKGIVQAWYPGMEGGNSLADILFGVVNPSGKLPMTFPIKLEDSPAHALAKYPDENLLIEHTEDIFVGYRYFDTYKVEPAFAFGHGLSYSDFEYKNLKANKSGKTVTLSLELKNTGQMNGGEVVQVYIKDEESSLKRPEKELKAFQKVFLDAGDSEIVKIELKEDAFRYYDDTQKKWVLESGTFIIEVGSSSRDIRVTSEVEF